MRTQNQRSGCLKRLLVLGYVVPVLSMLVQSGCVATVEERSPRVAYVGGPPPQPLLEPQGAPSSPGMVWVDGYWHWNGVKYLWIPGHWENPPPGRVWSPPMYSVVDGRYVYHAGRWRESVDKRRVGLPP